MKIEKIYRQGDVILFKIKEEGEYKSLEKKSEMILAKGEVTGHIHRLKGSIEVFEYTPGFDFFDELNTSTSILFKILDSHAVLTHEEHDIIVLEKGTYLKIQQIEYNPFMNKVRWVLD